MKDLNIKNVAQFFRDEIDWESIEEIAWMVKDCNDRLLRPMKGCSFEYAIEEHSQDKVKRIDEIGRDLLIKEAIGNILRLLNIEVKSTIDMFQVKKSKTRNIIMKNAHGTSIQEVNDQSWDYCLLVQSASSRKKYDNQTGFGVALVGYNSYLQNYVKKDATVECSFPYSDMEWIVKPEDSTLKSVMEERTKGYLTLEEVMEDAMRQFVTQGKKRNERKVLQVL